MASDGQEGSEQSERQQAVRTEWPGDKGVARISSRRGPNLWGAQGRYPLPKNVKLIGFSHYFGEGKNRKNKKYRGAGPMPGLKGPMSSQRGPSQD